jgi:hypothetical protein
VVVHRKVDCQECHPGTNTQAGEEERAWRALW